MEAQKQIAFGDKVKRLGDNKIGGYLVRFTDESQPDLAGDYFNADTYFGVEDGATVPVLFNHGLDKTMGNEVLAKGSLRKDKYGIWVETVLDERKEYTKYVMELVDKGALGLSSGAVGIPEWVPSQKAKWIKSWVIGEGSLTHTPCEPKTLVVPVKALLETTDERESKEAEQAGEQSEVPTLEVTMPEALTIKTENISITMPEITTGPNDLTVDGTLSVKGEPVATKSDLDAIASTLAALNSRLDEREKAASKTVEPQFSAPAIHMDGERKKYGKYSTGDLALTLEVLRKNAAARPASDAMVQELVSRMDSNDHKVAHPAVQEAYHKSFGGRIKADEIMYSTLASGGDEWVGVAYSTSLWDGVYSATNVVSRIPTFEFPAGAESMIDPIGTADPTYYKVAQATDLSSNPGGIPTNTVTSSQPTTSNVTHTLAKFGARTLYTGELSEDAVLNVAADLQQRLARSGAEHLESAVIDGDSATGATTNVNDIAGTPGGTEYWLNFDGFRKLPLVTNTANSRSAGSLTANDFLETMKLLGTAGQYAEPGKASFIVDANTYWKALELEEFKTRDVNSQATIESGLLANIWGFDAMQSFHMHKAQANRKANTSGKIDLDTAGNNTTGSILAVRWDRWKFGIRRRMSLESTRIPAADSTEIVVMMRGSLKNYDTDASAISYNVTL